MMINPKKLIGSVKSATQMGESSVRTVLWAGLGAYSKGTEQVGMAQHMMAKQLQDLVSKGSDVETEMVERIQETKRGLFGQAESQFNRGFNATCGIDRDRMSNFEKKVDHLQEIVEKLAAK
ncbi:phasin-related domain-containing protein [Photobacterium sp. DNB22_13_2]